MDIKLPSLEEIKNRKQTIKARNEREELLENFRSILNSDRVKSGYRPLTFVSLVMVLKHVPTGDLYAFYKKCSSAKEFSKCFWGSLKVK